MSRYRAVYDRHGLLAEYQDDELVWHRQGETNQKGRSGPQVVRDIEPYRSMIDGSVIDGRKRHRDHLRAHGCIEVGNDTSHMKPRETIKPKSFKQDLHRMLADCSDRDVQNMVKREIRNRR